MNPLLDQGELPDFSAIHTEHVVPAVREAIRLGDLKLAELEKVSSPTWQSFVLPLREISRRMERVWGVVNHLMGLKNSEELRAAHEEVQGEVVAFQLKVAQSRALYSAWEKLRANENELSSPARKRIVASALRDGKLAGVALDGKTKERFNAIQERLAELSTKFSNTVLDATKAFSLHLTQKDEIDGLPESWLAMGAAAAKAKGHSDGWLVTLDFPSYYPFLQHAKNRALREKVYRALVTRASKGTGGAEVASAKDGGAGDPGELNNWPIIDEILKLKREEAQILGYKNFAEVSLAAKMAPSADKIRAMIEDLATVAKPAAQKEITELGKVELWDVAYASERLREKLYNFTDEQLRPYFPLPKVVQGMFALATKLFGVFVKPSTPSSPAWHSDVLFYDVFDADDKKIASFYLDPYARSGLKRPGAWMDVCRQREVSAAGTTLPVAYLVCNGTPPAGEKPSLMTFTEVETLFHEFGHGLQHMLSRVDEYEAAGISNVEWDAVELPSQFMENWVYERFVIDEISGHVETGEKLPQALYEKIVAAKNFMAGSQLLRQLYFSLLDLELYDSYDGSISVRDIQKRIAAEYTAIAPLPEDAFLCTFSHIFAGGYAAGYYSYKWAEVLSADAFAAFEEAGLTNEMELARLGKKYRETVLALGGSEHPMEVYRQFRGRDATIDALIRHSGLKKSA